VTQKAGYTRRGGSKSAKFAVVSNVTQLWAARVWKCSKVSELCDKFDQKRLSPLFSSSLVMSNPRIPENRSVKLPHS